jgi:glycine dehydrogenase
MDNAMTRSDSFIRRHIGPTPSDVKSMLKQLGFDSMDQFLSKVVPDEVRMKSEFSLPVLKHPLTESECLSRMSEIASQNKVCKSYIGLGYYNTLTPTVIQRNILENPGWYTQYTPYQPEISQGRLEALLNFQTMIIELTGLPVANASLLDEGTAAAEAMSVAFHWVNKDSVSRKKFLVTKESFPQTIACIQTRAEPLDVEVVLVESKNLSSVLNDQQVFGFFAQYPQADGAVVDFTSACEAAKKSGALSIVAADILSLTMLKTPADMGADMAVGNTQRFGVPFGFGGPHAAYFACKDEFKRVIPGRIIGVSKDSNGNPALRLSLQTREQHIRREKATSNICTAQALLAVMASMYAVYHGPKGLKDIATRVHSFAVDLANHLTQSKFSVTSTGVFDTVTFAVSDKQLAEIQKRAEEKSVNLNYYNKGYVSVSIDESVTCKDLEDLIFICTGQKPSIPSRGNFFNSIPESMKRTSEFLTHGIFNRYHTETEFLRYVKRLESKELSLATSMIPLGSCTMKLNSTTEMLPVTWSNIGGIHPFAPSEQTKGFGILANELEQALCAITGFSAVTLQPNAGSQGEYAGLLVIRAYHHSQGQTKRDVCLIPKSAHGTNPASAVMAGMKVVVVNCDDHGNVDINDLKSKAEQYKDSLSALMITYPSTHGVFEAKVKEYCKIIHDNGGQVYLDGANLNAMVGIARPGDIGADVCHMNLHKTFCIPHGGGGPGVGPIGVAKHLAPFLPGHPVVATTGQNNNSIGPISAAPLGSASILPISWSYIAMMGEVGVKNASEVAILNANYMANRLAPYYPVLYKGEHGLVAHECILDLRSLKASAGIEVDDVAKRLMDFGFHAPTVSWPVPGTIMIEPTESESKQEMDRYCDALIAIKKEVEAIEAGKLDKTNNPLKNAPHTQSCVISDEWNRPYGRELAAYPASWLRDYKFWPSVGRVDASYGDRNLVCACLPLDAYEN